MRIFVSFLRTVNYPLIIDSQRRINLKRRSDMDFILHVDPEMLGGLMLLAPLLIKRK